MKISRRRLGSARIGVLAGAAMVALMGWPAHAASLKTLVPPPPAGPPPDDGLGQDGFYLEADELIRDEAKNQITAKGSVEARYRGRVLRAEEVQYDTVTGLVVARGKVQIVNADGTAQFADAMTLDKDLSEGVALGFSTDLAGEVKIGAASAVRQSADVTELNRAVYTPCKACADGQSEPTWSIRARKVVEDKKRQQIYFQDAVIEVRGHPVAYFPAFWTADPEADRKSGFLLPVVTYSKKRGFSYQQPYYQVISKSQDIIIAPQINTSVNPFLNLEWRRRFYSSVPDTPVDIRLGYTYDQDFDSHGSKFGDLTSRSYILGRGAFDITPQWRWGFTAERASDPLIFDKYDVPNVFIERGPYSADDRRLVSQLYATRQDDLSYLSVAAIEVQGLRSTDVQSTFPSVAPLIEGRWEPAQAILGGRLRIDGSGVMLQRQSDPINPMLPGVDSTRATLSADWRSAITLSNGLRVEPFLMARGDVYHLHDLPAPYASTATITRGFGTVGADISFPLIRQDANATYIIEPLAQIAISPNTQIDPRIPNEDSVVWEFDETNLFQVNKSPGFDLYEGGQRLNAGLRATAFLSGDRGGSILIGRSFRASQDNALPARTGLETESSDYILAAEATPLKGMNFFSSWRFDSGSFSVKRLEAGADFATQRVKGYIRYLQEESSPTGGRFKGLDFRDDIFITKRWGLTLAGSRDIAQGAWRAREVGLVYEDECIRFEILYRRDETINRTLGPSDSVGVRLTLATLGNSGYTR